MASVLQSVGSAVGWRNHEILPDLEDSPLPDRFRKKSSCNLSALRMSLRKRMPLKEVEINFSEDPTWESLQAKEKSQHLRTLTRMATGVLGTVSQVWERQRRLVAIVRLVGCLFHVAKSAADYFIPSSCASKECNSAGRSPGHTLLALRKPFNMLFDPISAPLMASFQSHNWCVPETVSGALSSLSRSGFREESLV